MACSSSIIGVPSIYQTNPSRRPIPTPLLSLPYSNEKSHFINVRLRHASLVASAVVTPNSSVLSEEAFKGIGGFGKDSLNVSSEPEYDSESEVEDDDESGTEDELAISKLGLPQRLADSLEKRGITHLFPIQVIPIFSWFFYPNFLLLQLFCQNIF